MNQNPKSPADERIESLLCGVEDDIDMMFADVKPITNVNDDAVEIMLNALLLLRQQMLNKQIKRADFEKMIEQSKENLDRFLVSNSQQNQLKKASDLHWFHHYLAKRFPTIYPTVKKLYLAH